MKNYLCTLKGNAHLLRQRVTGRDRLILDRIDRVVEKLESFTRGLAVAGDAATGIGEPVPFRPIEAALACARTHFHKRMGDFRFTERTQAAEMLCDPGRFEQVLLNLYANALEAGARRVDTEVIRDRERLLIRVEDDGQGCAREDLRRIFEPFFTTKSGPARRGLGMFIVQSIVENHGGRVRVAAKNGGSDGRTGLIFTLDFPLPVPNPEATLPSPLMEAQVPVEESWLLVPPVCLP
jgi:signal transduction histidine kinase